MDSQATPFGEDLLQCRCWLSAWMRLYILVLLVERLDERLIFLLTGVADFLGAQWIASQHITDACLIINLGQFVIEQLDLKDALFDEPLDLRLGDRRDVMKSLFAERFDLLRFDHPAVADKSHLAAAK